MPPSPDAYAAVLAILKAGAAYVPLDIEHTGERISRILKDSGAGALLTTSDRTRQFSGFRDTVIHLDSDRAEIDAESSLRLAPGEVGVSSRNLCYLIYTSGLTGPSKRVMVEHRHAFHLVQTEGEIFRFTPEDRIYQGASRSFDSSIEEMIPRGGTARLTDTADGPCETRPFADARGVVIDRPFTRAEPAFDGRSLRAS